MRPRGTLGEVNVNGNEPLDILERANERLRRARRLLLLSFGLSVVALALAITAIVRVLT